MDKTRLVEKPYRDKTKKDKKEITLNTKNIKNKIINLKKTEEEYENSNNRIQETKKTTKLQKNNMS